MLHGIHVCLLTFLLSFLILHFLNVLLPHFNQNEHTSLVWTIIFCIIDYKTGRNVILKKINNAKILLKTRFLN